VGNGPKSSKIEVGVEKNKGKMQCCVFLIFPSDDDCRRDTRSKIGKAPVGRPLAYRWRPKSEDQTFVGLQFWRAGKTKFVVLRNERKNWLQNFWYAKQTFC